MTTLGFKGLPGGDGGSIGTTSKASQGSWTHADGTEVADLRAILEGPLLERQPQFCPPPLMGWPGRC